MILSAIKIGLISLQCRVAQIFYGHAVHIKAKLFSASTRPSDETALVFDGTLYIFVDCPVVFLAAVVVEAYVRRVRVAAFQRHQAMVSVVNGRRPPSPPPACRHLGERDAPPAACCGSTTTGWQLAFQHLDVLTTPCTAAARQRSTDVQTTCKHA